MVKGYAEMGSVMPDLSSQKAAETCACWSPGRPFEIVHADFRGPLPETKAGFRHIIVFIDGFTHWPEAKCLTRANAASVADAFFECVISRHGCPSRLLTDRGSQFVSGMMRRLHERLGTQGLLTSPYHPQTNGKVERFMRYFNEAISAFQFHKREDWDELLPYVLYAYRMNMVRSIGCSPFQMLYGRVPVTPEKLWLGEHAREEARMEIEQ